MKRKKGFTLIELLAVIAILILLIGLSTGIFINVRKNILNNQYENVKLYIESKAVEYANDTSIQIVSVEKLIKEGYVNPDDETDIYDPRDRSSLNCFLVEITKAGEKYNAKLGEDLGKDNNQCNTYEVSSDYEICRVDGNECKDIDPTEWFKDSLYLAVKDQNGVIVNSDASIEWSNNFGFSSNDSQIEAIGSIDSVSLITYKAIIKTKDEDGKSKIGEAIKSIKFDKEKPIITDTDLSPSGWSESKTLQATASDKNGSGIFGMYIIKDGSIANKKCSTTKTDYYQTSIRSEVYYKNGPGYICVMDKAGNVLDAVDFKVENIDDIKPKAEVTLKSKSPSLQIPGNWTKGPYEATIKFSDMESGLKSYAIINNSTALPKDSDWKPLSGISSTQTITISENGSYYVWVKDQAGNDNGRIIALNGSETNVINIRNIDNEGPEIELAEWDYSCSSYEFEFSFSYYVSDKSGVDDDKSRWKVTTSSTAKNNGWKSLDWSTSSLSCSTRYYIWIKEYDNLGNYTIKNIKSFKCNCSDYEDEDNYDDGGDSGNSSNTPALSYSANHVCSNIGQGCQENGYYTGECIKDTNNICSTTYTCYCCSRYDRNNYRIMFDGVGSCVTY